VVVLSSTNTSKAVAQVIVVLVVVAGAAFLINSNVAGIQVYNVYPTISMLPTLEVGDLVVVHSVTFNTIQVNDVIVFSRPDSSGVCTSASEVIVHRVVGITQQGLITQGDDRATNPVPDEPGSWPPVPASCVKGIVVVSLPYLGRVTEAFPPPYNYVLVAAILALVFLLEVRPWGGKNQDDKPVGPTGPAEDGPPQSG
jgi:signal peptidase I